MSPDNQRTSVKILIYGGTIGLLSALFAWLGWYWPAGFLLGLCIGFAAAVDRVYFIATGEKLTGAEAEKVYNKVLSRK